MSDKEDGWDIPEAELHPSALVREHVAWALDFE